MKTKEMSREEYLTFKGIEDAISKQMSHTERIGKIIGEYTYTFEYGDFCKITPTKQLSEKETLELFEYIYNNIASEIPIQVFNTFNNINYFEWRTQQ